MSSRRLRKGTVFAALILIWLMPAGLMGPSASAAVATDRQRPELAYLKQVNAWRVPSDPQLIFLLMAQFDNAGRQGEGAEYFAHLRATFDRALDPEHRAWYLVAEAALRARHAREVNLLTRIAYLRATLRLLDAAHELTGGSDFMTHWMSGIVRAQLPGFFGERVAAISDLDWCVAHQARGPHPGWLREVYFQLASLHRARGDFASAARYQAMSGLAQTVNPITYTSRLSEDPATGHGFSFPAVREVVTGTVYLATGFDFTEHYFVVTADRRELVAIDMGTRVDSSRAAVEALRSAYPRLPPITTVMVTHAHFDHVGGQRYYRGLSPAPRIFGRQNFRVELEHDAAANPDTLHLFFGTRYRGDDVLDYHPDVAIDRPVNVLIGQTTFQLLPTSGGETPDALLINLPQQGVLFAGDAFMPYFGAPFVNEGSVDGFLAAIDQVHALHPAVILHGHEPLTRLFFSSQVLDDLREPLTWLRDRVLRDVGTGIERSTLHAANLVPPNLKSRTSAVHLAYMVLRDNLIDRTYQQATGYWQPRLHGLDALTDADRGELLTDYLEISESRIAEAAQRLVTDGKHEMAAELLRWADTRFPGSARLGEARRLAYLKLMEKYQEFNPFKYILYSAEIGQATPVFAAPLAQGTASVGCAP